MQNETLQYHILDENKQPMYQNDMGHIETGSGVLKTDGTPAKLRFSPLGWAETLINFGRNNRYLGLFRAFSIPLEFPKDGAKILRHIKWTVGMEAIRYLTISKLHPLLFPDTYQTWYTGEFDFSKFRQKKNGVDIQLVEGGLSKLLKAYEGTTFEVPIYNNPNRFSLYLDGLTFKNAVEWQVFGEQDITGSDKYLGAGIISQEGTSQGITVQDQPFDFTSTYPNGFWLSSADNKTVTQNYQVNLKLWAKENVFILIRFEKRNLNGTVTNYNIVSGAYTAGQRVDINQSYAIPMDDGDRLYLVLKTPFVSTGTNWYSIEGGSIKLDYNVRFNPSLCECLTWMELFERLTEKLTGGKYGAKSDFLSSLTGTQAVTSGQAIRQYRSEAVIKTSMNDFFKACQRWGVGLAIENDMLIIEKHDYFFRTETVLELDEIKDFECYDAEDLMINTIKVGYANQTYDNVNGKDEFNVTQQRTTPITRVVKELDLVCPYRADMFGIELMRLELYKKDTTDNKGDNETFILDVLKGTDYDYYRGTFETQVNTGSYFVLIPSVLFELAPGSPFTFGGNTFTVLDTFYIIAGYTYVQVLEPVTNGATFNESISTYDAEVYKLNRPAFSPITGLINPDQAYNVNLSPTESLLNNAAYIHSLMDMQDAGKLLFQSGEKNSALSRTLAGRTVTENADLNIYDLAPKIFKPYYFKFTTEVPINLPVIMRATPYGLISFPYKGDTYKGFMWDGGAKPAKVDSQEWILLCGPDNDMLKLINEREG